MAIDPDWWRDEEATECMADAAREAQFESELDAHIADIHEWLDGKYGEKYKLGQTDLCFEALLVCQTEKVPSPTWLIEALRAEVELAVRRPIGWAQLKIAAQEANERRKSEAEKIRAWCMEQAAEVLMQNPTLNSESRLADLIATRAKGTDCGAVKPRTIRRHIKGILAKRAKRGQS